MAQAVTADNTNLLIQIAGTLNNFKQSGILTDAMVSAATTRAALINAIQSAPVHNDTVNRKFDLVRALNVSGLTDSDVNGVTTVAALIALLGVSTPSIAVLN